MIRFSPSLEKIVVRSDRSYKLLTTTSMAPVYIKSDGLRMAGDFFFLNEALLALPMKDLDKYAVIRA